MKAETVIVGGGPGGSAMAMFLLREGIRPVIIERESFPRYHIGESLTGAGGKVLRDLGLDGEMYRRKYPTKQGVEVYGQSKSGSWFVPVTGRDENWKLFPQDTWQVRRSDFDTMMLKEAEARGAVVIPGRALKPLLDESGAIRGVRIEHAHNGKGIEDIETRMLVDASGQATWLANLGHTGPKYRGSYDKQIAIFSQVSCCIREDGGTRDSHPDNTLIFYRKKYHWAWFIPLDKDIVSIGIVSPSSYFLDQKESKREFYVRELRDLHPQLSQRIPEVKLAEDVHVIPNYSYQVRGFTGKGFICIGDAHRFIDPIFSFGATVTMREAQIAAPAIKAYLAGVGRDMSHPFADLELYFEKGIDILEDCLDSFWEHPLSFAVCVHLKHTEHMTDMLAGRLYERQPSPAIADLRTLLKRTEERERSYEPNAVFSMPIGSRYHPERAPIWEVGSEVESTEAWMGAR